MYEDEQYQHIRERELQYRTFKLSEKNRIKLQFNFPGKAKTFLSGIFTWRTSAKPFVFKSISLTRMGIIVLILFLIGIALLTIGLLRLIK